MPGGNANRQKYEQMGRQLAETLTDFVTLGPVREVIRKGKRALKRATNRAGGRSRSSRGRRR